MPRLIMVYHWKKCEKRVKPHTKQIVCQQTIVEGRNNAPGANQDKSITRLPGLPGRAWASEANSRVQREHIFVESDTRSKDVAFEVQQDAYRKRSVKERYQGKN